ncbi:MAG: hypothetical protein MSG64_08530 [Pyrinomonadaceae bacterium MAG19_C2-C3]|nr:hypothetical protein [Pyrinomonadaceae bacterium MAG19_C2-C3]
MTKLLSVVGFRFYHIIYESPYAGRAALPPDVRQRLCLSAQNDKNVAALPRGLRHSLEDIWNA